MAKKTKSIEELRKIFEESDDSKSRLALSLLDKANFMEKTLAVLQKEVEEGGVTTTMCQGNYYIERENPALKSYNTTIKNYASVIKQLNDMLPKNEGTNSDSFEDF